MSVRNSSRLRTSPLRRSSIARSVSTFMIAAMSIALVEHDQVGSTAVMGPHIGGALGVALAVQQRVVLRHDLGRLPLGDLPDPHPAISLTPRQHDLFHRGPQLVVNHDRELMRDVLRSRRRQTPLGQQRVRRGEPLNQNRRLVDPPGRSLAVRAQHETDLVRHRPQNIA